VRRADAVCSQYARPAGVTFSFQVCEYSIEPTVANCACNLLAKDALRVSLSNELEPRRPEVPFVGLGFAFAGAGEGLTGATPRPNGNIVWPSCKLQGEIPAADTGEKIGAVVSVEIGGLQVCNTSLIYYPLGYGAVRLEFAQPCGGARINFVVEGFHSAP
jgi:hypothetical protein